MAECVITVINHTTQIYFRQLSFYGSTEQACLLKLRQKKRNFKQLTAGWWNLEDDVSVAAVLDYTQACNRKWHFNICI